MILRFCIIFLIFIFTLIFSEANSNFEFYFNIYSLKNAFISIIISSILIKLEMILHKVSINKILFGFLGILSGSILGIIIDYVLFFFFPNFPSKVFIILFSYIGFVILLIKEKEFLNFVQNLHINSIEDMELQLVQSKILDTSVIIDGRIIDIAESGFLEGVLLVPKFVLNELQMVADSSDPLKRSRGRRGLDILNKIKSSKKVLIKIVDDDFQDVSEVDAKLLKLAKIYKNSVIITNDFNLNKVAELEGIPILNINELAAAIKPILLPNEELKVTVIKEGKDQNQGISYLEDGTMIVIDNGKDYIGKEVTVTVNSILQTSAGRMIFTQIINN